MGKKNREKKCKNTAHHAIGRYGLTERLLSGRGAKPKRGNLEDGRTSTSIDRVHTSLKKREREREPSMHTNFAENDAHYIPKSPFFLLLFRFLAYFPP